MFRQQSGLEGNPAPAAGSQSVDSSVALPSFYMLGSLSFPPSSVVGNVSSCYILNFLRGQGFKINKMYTRCHLLSLSLESPVSFLAGPHF